ncbi:MAG: SUMF1/EgtB/PvdO family nonheme iron enzyme, partial [Polyangiales bacterium]
MATAVLRALRDPRIAVVLGGVSLAGAIASCSFPDYFAAEPPTDGPIDEDSSTTEAGVDSFTPEADSAPGVSCNDGGVKAGQAIACSCTAVSDASPSDADEAGDTSDGGDAGGAGGLRACTQAGTIGACIGCPAAAPCEGAPLPADTTCVVGSVVKLGVVNTNVCAPAGCAVEAPEHTVALTRFFLDDHEVTVRRFRNWWNLGAVAPKAGDVMFTAGDGTVITWKAAWKVVEPTKADGSNDATWLGQTVSTNDDAAINYVDWPTALAFCAAFGRRLPTEAEWEAAASGRENRLFPFEPRDTKANQPTAAMVPCTKAISAAGGSSCGAPKGLATP